ncbi:MAG: Unknown protein, partial [uncultured Thiotrichaceae bacterium]
CYQITTSGGPAERAPGPFCPRTISEADVDNVGAWFNVQSINGDGSATLTPGDLVDLTGSFISSLPALYDDSNWQLYDSQTGDVRYTGTLESCSGAAQPNVEAQYQQTCVECEMDYLDDDFEITYLIPVTPIAATAVEDRIASVGLALDGAELSGSAPVQDILSNYTIAAFDDCGGHINLHQGYHYHATTGCTDTTNTTDGHAPLIGYAVDGYPIYAMKDAGGNEAEGLDECRGQTDDTRGYHYHAASASENRFIGCLTGQYAATNTDTGGGEPTGGPDFTAAIATLNSMGYSVTLAQLEAALGTPPDFTAAATTLGIPYDVLVAALPAPPQ